MRVYDIRYVISLPGEFDLTKYLTSTDGHPIDDLPPFPVRGLTSLTKDIETRIQEIENVGVHIWHGYYESLAGLGCALGGLAGGADLHRPAQTPAPSAAGAAATVARGTNRPLAGRDGTGRIDRRREGAPGSSAAETLARPVGTGPSNACPFRAADIEASPELGQVYGVLQTWLHNPGPASASRNSLTPTGNPVIGDQ